MLETKLRMTNVDQLEVELTLKMSLGELKRLNNALADEDRSTPVWDVKRAIEKVVSEATQTFDDSRNFSVGAYEMR